MLKPVIARSGTSHHALIWHEDKEVLKQLVVQTARCVYHICQLVTDEPSDLAQHLQVQAVLLYEFVRLNVREGATLPPKVLVNEFKLTIEERKLITEALINYQAWRSTRSDIRARHHWKLKENRAYQHRNWTEYNARFLA